MKNEDMGEIQYQFPQMGKLKVFIIFFIFIIAGFSFYFPTATKVEQLLTNSLGKIPGCPISVQNVKFEWFFPKLNLEQIKIPAGCLGPKGLEIKETKLNFRGFNFSPFGPHFKTDINVKGSPISAYITLGLTKILLKIDDNILNLEHFQNALPQNISLKGKVNLNLFLLMSHSGEVKDLKTLMKSTNLIVPSQMISMLKLPDLNIGNLFIKAEMDESQKLNIQNLNIGDDESPIRVKFGGNIDMQSTTIQNSRLDLKGEMAFSQDFLEKFAIIKLLMGKFNQKDNFYQIKINGPLSGPSTSTY